MLELVSEDQPDGIGGHGADALDGPGQVLGRAPAAESASGAAGDGAEHVLDGSRQVPTRRGSGLAGGFEVDAGVEEPERHGQQPGAGDPEAARVRPPLALEGTDADQPRERARRSRSEQVCELRLVDHARAILGPGGSQPVPKPEPVVDRKTRRRSPFQQLPDRPQVEPAILEPGDQLEPLCVVVAVDGTAPAALGTRDEAPVLVEADRATGNAGARDELVDGVFRRPRPGRTLGRLRGQSPALHPPPRTPRRAWRSGPKK